MGNPVHKPPRVDVRSLIHISGETIFRFVYIYVFKNIVLVINKVVLLLIISFNLLVKLKLK